MSVFGLFRGSRSNSDQRRTDRTPIDRRESERSAIPASHPAESQTTWNSRARAELLETIQDLESARTMTTPVQDAAHDIELHEMRQLVEGIDESSPKEDLFEQWSVLRHLASHRTRQEGIFVEGRFFEYQQLLFEFSHLLRQLDESRTKTLREVRKLLSGGSSTTTDLGRIKDLLDSEEKAMRSARRSLVDRLQSIRSILLEDRVPPEIDERFGLLSKASFRSAISRYINVSGCIQESLHLLTFSFESPAPSELLIRALTHAFQRQADCHGFCNESDVGILVLNVTTPNVKKLMANVAEFIASADAEPTSAHYGIGRIDDTPEMLIARCTLTI